MCTFIHRHRHTDVEMLTQKNEKNLISLVTFTHTLHTYLPTHTYVHAHIRTYTCTHTHTHINTYTHIHIYTYIGIFRWSI